MLVFYFFFVSQTLFAQNFSEADTIFANEQHQKGEIALEKGNYSEAQDLLWEAFVVRKERLGWQHSDALLSLNALADLFEQTGRYVLAERVYLKMLEITKSNFGTKNTNYARNLDNLGRIYLLKGDLQNAEIFHKNAAEIYTQNQSPDSVLNLLAQANLYYQTGQFTASEYLYKQGLFLFSKTNVDQKKYFEILRNLALLYIKLNNFAEAHKLLKEVLAHQEKQFGKTHPNYAKTLKDLANVYLSANYDSLALPLLEQSKEIWQSKGQTMHFDYLLTIKQLAEANRKLKHFEESEKLYLGLLDTFRLVLSENHIEYAKLESNVGNLYYHMGKYEEAIAHHEIAQDLRKNMLDALHPDYISGVNDLSMLTWANGNLGVSERLHQQSVENYLQQFQRYFAFLSEQEKALFYKEIHEFFEQFDNFILLRSRQKPKLLGDMYDRQLATKALLFHTNQEIREQVLQSKDANLIRTYRRWIELKEQLAKVYKLGAEELEAQGIQIDSLQNVANYLEKAISLRVKLDQSKKDKTQRLDRYSWQDIRKNLQADEAAVEMLRFRKFLPDSGGRFIDSVFYVALIVTPETLKNPEMVVLANGKELETKHLALYRNQIRFRLLDKNSYNLFWKPLQEAQSLKNVRKIFFSPDGFYNQINLNTLWDTEKKKYLLDQLEIQLVSNTKDIIKLRENKTQSLANSSVLIGFPDYEHQGLDTSKKEQSNISPEKKSNLRQLTGFSAITPLFGTKAEIEGMKNLYEKYDFEHLVFLGKEASEANLKKYPNPRTLHVATHGFFVMPEKKTQSAENEPLLEGNKGNILMNSGLLLAGASHAYSPETMLAEMGNLAGSSKTEDGILTAYEAMNLDLSQTELVIMSACETGLGEVKIGEGVYGLQRSFQSAGAKTIVMSLWKVDDAATQMLMLHFKTEWFKTQNKRQAFRKAQYALRENAKFEHPYFWGAFVMIGE